MMKRLGKFRRFAKRAAKGATIASFAAGSFFAKEAKAQSLQPDTAKFNPALDYRGPNPSGFNATTNLVTDRIPVFLDFTKAKGSSKLWVQGLTGRGNVGMHFAFQRELEAKNVPDFFNFGLNAKIANGLVAGASVSAAKGSKPYYELGLKANYGKSSLIARKNVSANSPPVVAFSTFREINGTKVSAFLSGNASGKVNPKFGLSLDRGTRAFEVSFGPNNERAIAIINQYGDRHYISFIYSTTGKENRFTIELFRLF